MKEKTENISRFFVDEAGDLTLFNKAGKIIVGNEGVSKVFMVGVTFIHNYFELDRELLELRKQITSNEYFQGVPSLESTKKQFHACKDIPEIRSEVFKILKKYDIDVFVAIKRKRELAEFAKELHLLRFEKIKENDIYDDLIKRLFRNLLHKADSNLIYFSRRGKSNRTQSLETSIKKAKNNFEQKYGTASDKPTKIYSNYPYEVTGLQVIDYFLWALQRFYEKSEDRFYNYVKDKYKIIMDLDDKRNKEYGEWYSDRNRLDLKKMKPLES